ncbi:MAG: hypothetical protein ACKPEY_02870 [Planctomycetota bacterium]
MNVDRHLSGLRFLVVEDDEPTNERLKHVIETSFPDCEVMTAFTVEEGRKLVLQAKDSPFDVAVVDLKLPQRSRGDAPEFSSELKTELMIAFRDIVIIHISAYEHDPKIAEFVKGRDSLLFQGQIFIAKSSNEEGDWFSRLVNKVRMCLHTRRIQTKFNDLFVAPMLGSAPRGYSGISRGRSDRGRSLDLADLCDDGQSHWEYLPDSLRADLARVLGHVQDSRGRNVLGVMSIEDFNTQEPRP